MANVFVTIEKDVEVEAEKLLAWVTSADKAVAKLSPGALAALAILFGGVEKALTDVSGAAQNPIAALINAPAELADFKAVWPELKTLAASLGIKL